VSTAFREAVRLISNQRWFALATVDEERSPTVSYMPFAVVGTAFVFVASRLAAHTANLLARRPASVLLIANEAPDEAGDAYARPRLTVSVRAIPASPGSAPADGIWSCLQTRQGPTVDILRTLPDFAAIALEPIGGRLISGFAAAHDLDGPTMGQVLLATADQT
jgi:putative heme iron utilization protein